MRALIHTRVSHDKKGEGRSVAEQEAECRAWSEREGWTVVKVITETGSASRFAKGPRAQWAEVTRELGTNEYDILLTWEGSRATRKLDVYADLRDLCAAAGVLWGYSGVVFDLTDRSDRFRTGLDALMSEDESHRTSERVNRSVRARATAGTPHGALPYGYRREYDPNSGSLLRQVPHEETAPIVREVFQHIADGHTLAAVARDLTAREVPPPRPSKDRQRGDVWLTTSIRQLVRSHTYAGRRTYRGEVVGPAAWPALVDEELWARANAAVDSNTRRSPKDCTARYLLSGIARCGGPGCGGPMYKQKNGESATYVCAWCHKVARIITRTDEVTTYKVLAILERFPSAAPNASANTSASAEAWKEVRALRDRLDSFADQAADGDLTAGSLARVEARLVPQIKTAEAKAQRLSAPVALAGYDFSDPAALWDSLDLEGKRTLVRRAVTVTIHPTGGSRVWSDDRIDVVPNWA